MEITVGCTIISSEALEQSTYARTGEVTPARGEIYILTKDRGKPTTKKVGCSHTIALEMEKREINLSVGDIVAETLLPVDFSEYKLENGRQGISLKLIEPKDMPKEQFLDSLGLLKPKPAAAGNGSAAPVGVAPQQRPVMTA